MLDEIILDNKTIIGIMTGTSIDNIDIVAVKFQITNNNKYKFELLASGSYPFSKDIELEIKNVIKEKVNISTISQLNFVLSYVFVDTIKNFILKNNIDFKIIDAISIHGQTVWHNPFPSNFAGNMIASTLQLTNGSVISSLLNKTVISDFRSADIAAGGQGAPLVPIFDYYFLVHNNSNVIALNIGGMANITFIPVKANIDDIVAFDTGCGNILIDEYCQKYLNIPFDKDGNIARVGSINEKLLNELLNLEYFKLIPPKSCGREIFHLKFVENILRKLNLDISNNDILRTLTELSAITIVDSIKYCCNNAVVVVKGGGKNNSFLMELIKNKASNRFSFILSDSFGISSTYYESIAFAFLGFLSLKNKFGNVPRVTGANKKVILGTISKNFSK